MPDVRQPAAEDVDVSQGPDRVVQALLVGVFFVVVSILVVVLYGFMSGTFSKSAPRTSAEAALRLAQSRLAANSGDGQSWANLAHILYISGDKTGAWTALKNGREKVKVTDNDVLWLDLAEMDLLIRDAKNTEAATKGKEYVKTGIAMITKVQKQNQQSGVNIPIDQLPEAQVVTQLLISEASAQGNIKDWKGAIASLDSALLFDPNAADVMDMRAAAKLEAGDKAGAKKDWQDVLRYLPEDAAATQGLATLSKTN
jgi:tetratricopeptide (TPR) repeat protein